MKIFSWIFRPRLLHRWVAVVAFVFIVSSATTGLLWAYAPYLYWQSGYMKHKKVVEPVPLSAVRFSISDAVAQLRERFGKNIIPVAVTLRSDAGMLIYDIRYIDTEGIRRSALLNAVSAEWVSPLSETDAVRYALQYVEGTPQLKEASFLKNWTHRNGGDNRSVWRISFSDPGETEVFIDPDTGEILEDQNSTRRFHFWIMRIHQLNFFGTKKILTIIAGLPLLTLAITGLWMIMPLSVSRRNRDVSS